MQVVLFWNYIFIGITILEYIPLYSFCQGACALRKEKNQHLMVQIAFHQIYIRFYPCKKQRFYLNAFAMSYQL